LKRQAPEPGWDEQPVSPGLTAGGGLKLVRDLNPLASSPFPPASPPGAD